MKAMETRDTLFKSLIFFIIIIGAVVSPGIAQNFCSQTLKRAQTAYDEGRISEVPIILEQCINNGFNKEEKTNAYRLITLTYLYLDEPKNAEQSMLKLLRLSPEYKINPAVDPSEFINLYNTFRTHPIYRIGLKGGMNSMFVRVTEEESSNGDFDENIKVKSSVGFQLGLASEIPLNDKVELCPELLFTSKEFKFNYSTAAENSTYKERINFISLPFLIKYSMGTQSYIPYITAGAEVTYLLSAVGSTGGDINSPNFDVRKSRNPFGYSLALGTGVKSKIGPGIFSFGLRFLYGLSDHVHKAHKIPDNGNIALSYGVVNSQLKLNTLNINVGYMVPIYKPKKIR